MDHDPDQHPITTILDPGTVGLKLTTGLDWKGIDNGKLRKIVTEKLDRLHKPKARTALGRYVINLVNTTKEASGSSCP